MLLRLTIWAALVVALASAAGPSVIWSSRLDLGQEELALGVDSREDVIVATGWFTDSARTAGCITVKYNQSGETVWTRTFATGLDDYGVAVAIDNENNIYVVGYSTIVLDRPRLLPRLLPAASLQDYDAIVLKYDANGELKWSHAIPGYAALGVACDDSGKCYVCGLAGDLNTSSDFWCAGFSSSGESLWSKTLDFGALEVGYRASALPDQGFACCNFVISPLSAGVMLKVSPSGETLWTRQLSLGYYTSIYGVDSDRDGNIFGGGMFIDWTAAQHLLAVKFDSTGSNRWLRTLAIDSTPQAIGAACDDSGNCYLAGEASYWPARALAAKFSSDGETLWTTSWDDYEDAFYEVACDPDGNPIFAGGASDGSDFDILLVKFSSVSGLEQQEQPVPLPIPQFSLAEVSPGKLALHVRIPGDYRLEIYDPAGRHQGWRYDGFLAAGRHRLAVGSLPTGVYIVRCQNPDQTLSCYRTTIVQPSNRGR